jgi:hypothetical protein
MLNRILEKFDDWWEDTGSWVDRSNIYNVAKKAFLCGYNLADKGICDGTDESFSDERGTSRDDEGSGKSSNKSNK